MKAPYIGFILSLLLKLWWATLRKDCSGIKEYMDRSSLRASGPTILTFWHGHQLFMPFYYLRHLRAYWPVEIYAIISQHGDGRIAAETVKRLGVHSVAGSSTRGGTRAFLQLLKQLRKGNIAGITPDGPKGPIYKVKPGVIHLAAKTSVPIMPVVAVCPKAFRFKSWDQMLLPYPFSKILFVVGEEICVPDTIDAAALIQYSEQLESTLIDLEAWGYAYLKSNLNKATLHSE